MGGPHTNNNKGINADMDVNSNAQLQETYVTDSLDQNSIEDDPDQEGVIGNTGNEFALQRIS